MHSVAILFQFIFFLSFFSFLFFFLISFYFCWANHTRQSPLLSATRIHFLRSVECAFRRRVYRSDGRRGLRDTARYFARPFVWLVTSSEHRHHLKRTFGGSFEVFIMWCAYYSMWHLIDEPFRRSTKTVNSNLCFTHILMNWFCQSRCHLSPRTLMAHRSIDRDSAMKWYLKKKKIKITMASIERVSIFLATRPPTLGAKRSQSFFDLTGANSRRETFPNSSNSQRNKSNVN